jgi:hypothetical protein
MRREGFLRIVDAVPVAAIGIAGGLAVLASAAWALRASTMPPAEFATEAASTVALVRDDAVSSGEVPEAAWTASLYDELDPPPPKQAEAPPAPPPPPRLEVQLKAILATADGDWRAFVFDPGQNDYLTMAPGDSVGSATLSRVEAGAAVFMIGAREIRLEIDG